MIMFAYYITVILVLCVFILGASACRDTIKEQIGKLSTSLPREVQTNPELLRTVVGQIAAIGVKAQRWQVIFTWLAVLWLAASIIGSSYVNVWVNTMQGRADLAKAVSTKQILIETAKSKEEAAKFLADAEIKRAAGIAQANNIIGNSLGGPEGYLRWLHIEGLRSAQGNGATIIYVPTEAGLPILEAQRLSKLSSTVSPQSEDSPEAELEVEAPDNE